MKQFTLKADYAPVGDQGEAIRQLADGIRAGDRMYKDCRYAADGLKNTLLGVSLCIIFI